MNIQVNLLPEAKMASIRNKAKRKSYTSITLSLLFVVLATSATFVLLYGFLLGTYRAGEQTTATLKVDISKNSAMEEKATTLQDNLAAFSLLNETRTYSSRIFVNLFRALPSNINIGSVEISEDNVISLTGTTQNYSDVAKFANSLELYNVDYLPQEGLPRTPIFSNVEITSISKAENGTVNFGLNAKVDQEILKKQAGN